MGSKLKANGFRSSSQRGAATNIETLHVRAAFVIAATQSRCRPRATGTARARAEVAAADRDRGGRAHARAAADDRDHEVDRAYRDVRAHAHEVAVAAIVRTARVTALPLGICRHDAAGAI